MFYIIVYIYIVNYKDMRRINENDMSRIIKKVLREESNEKIDLGVDTCFRAAGMPVNTFCKNFQNLGPLVKMVCIEALGTKIMLSNAVKIGTLIACLGGLAAIGVNSELDKQDKVYKEYRKNHPEEY